MRLGGHVILGRIVYRRYRETMTRNLKKQLEDGQTLIGGYIQTASPELVAIMAYAGFDYVILSSEDTPYDYETRNHQVDVARFEGIGTIYRPPKNDPVYIRRGLDIGMDGLNVPEVNSAEEARSVVRSALFHPAGERGLNAMCKMARYGADYGPALFEQINNQTLITVLIENAQAIENIDGIAQIEGIDVLYLGPTDLAISLGVPGQPFHPLVEEATEKVLEAGRKHNKAVGHVVLNPLDENEMRRKLDAGYQMLSLFLDVSFFRVSISNLYRRAIDIIGEIQQ